MAVSLYDAQSQSGELKLSVIATTFAFLASAKRMARIVRWEYHGKLMPIKTSSSEILNICSNISLMLIVLTI